MVHEKERKAFSFIRDKCQQQLTAFVYPFSELETVIDSSGMPPLMSPRSPIGRHSIVGAKPGLHLQVNAPGLFMHSVDARSH